MTAPWTEEDAAERRLLAAAVRALKDADWDWRFMRSNHGTIGLSLDTMWRDNRDQLMVTFRHWNDGRSHIVADFYPASVAQAVDLLVTFGVLPADLHSSAREIAHLRDLHREALQRIDGLVADLAAYVPAVDYDGDNLVLLPHIYGPPVFTLWPDRMGALPDDAIQLYRKVTPGGAE